MTVQDPVSTMDTRVAKVQARVPDEHVQRLTFDLSQIDDDGVFVDVNAAGFGRLDHQLSWRQIGIEDEAFQTLAMRVRAPKVDLLPNEHRKALLVPADRAYDVLARYSLSLGEASGMFGLSGYRWVPWTAFEAFEAAFAECCEQLDDAKAAVLAEYPEIRAQLTDSFVRLAKDAARRFTAVGAQLDSNFVAGVVEQLETRVPSAGHIQAMALTRRVGVVLLGSELAAERSKIAQSDAELETKQRIEQIKREETRKQLQEATSPIVALTNQLQATVYESVRTAAESVMKNGLLHPSTAASLRKMAETFRLMNWRNDAELGALVDKLDAMAAEPTTTNKTRVGDLMESMSDLLDHTLAASQAVSQPRRLLEL